MTNRRRIILSCVSLALLLAGTWYAWAAWTAREDSSRVSISTDREEYSVHDIVRITIHNAGSRPVDIFCPSWCALGNFPTTVERRVEGRWEYLAGFCPSIEPLFGSGTVDGEYIRHTLAPGASFELAISNFEALRLEKEEEMRVVYYVGGLKEPVYSRVFTVRP